MQTLLHISIAFLLVWSTSGLRLARHYCMGSLRQAGWYSVEPCGGEHVRQQDKPVTYRSGESLSAIPCCTDEADWLQTDEPFTGHEFKHLSAPAPQVLRPASSLMQPLLTVVFPPEARGPPPGYRPSLQVAYQVFRL